MKKGISPLIASVLLIAFVILSFILIQTWVRKSAVEEDTPIEEVECKESWECKYPLNACLNNTCVECIGDIDCNSFYITNKKCINNICKNIEEDCKILAKKDYKLSNPMCDYFTFIGECSCCNYVIDKQAERIEIGDTYKIIDEEGHKENNIQFEIKEEYLEEKYGDKYE